MYQVFTTKTILSNLAFVAIHAVVAILAILAILAFVANLAIHSILEHYYFKCTMLLLQIAFFAFFAKYYSTMPMLVPTDFLSCTVPRLSLKIGKMPISYGCLVTVQSEILQLRHHSIKFSKAIFFFNI